MDYQMTDYVEELSQKYQTLFNENGYAHLKDFVDIESCKKLTVELKKLVDTGLTTKDDQCAKSQAIHGAPVFDSLLEQLLPYFEKACGKRLYPTYAYARLYAPGEELKIHRDRPACEISATLTLGYDGEVWPILVAEEDVTKQSNEAYTIDDVEYHVKNKNTINMKIGDAVLYKGCELFHWRKEYTQGNWQAQVFLHYVDADGPNASQIYDGRGKLSHHTGEITQNSVFSETYYPDSSSYFFVVKNAFSKETCERIITSTMNENGIAGAIGNGIINKEVRDVNKLLVPNNLGIGATLTGIGIGVNASYFNFDIKKSNQSEFLRYDKNGHYKAHLDTFMNPNADECRKLTVLLFLNDDFEGGKLYLQFGNEKTYPPQEAGTVIVFPSFLLHGVEPIIKGKRTSMVTWLVGSWFK
jgi:predicted 2-oxoglutarate/Fe(II)-dependent dioxygenase YbiX